MNLGLRSEKRVTNCLRYGMAIMLLLSLKENWLE
jgi:hypothetical protein